MIKIQILCDVCLRPRQSARGWFGVDEVLQPQITDFTTLSVRITRTLRIEPLTAENAPHLSACCGQECLGKRVQVFLDTLMRECAEAAR